VRRTFDAKQNGGIRCRLSDCNLALATVASVCTAYWWPASDDQTSGLVQFWIVFWAKQSQAGSVLWDAHATGNQSDQDHRPKPTSGDNCTGTAGFAVTLFAVAHHTFLHTCYAVCNEQLQPQGHQMTQAQVMHRLVRNRPDYQQPAEAGQVTTHKTSRA
jgi:hypothetical protein